QRDHDDVSDVSDVEHLITGDGRPPQSYDVDMTPARSSGQLVMALPSHASLPCESSHARADARSSMMLSGGFSGTGSWSLRRCTPGSRVPGGNGVYAYGATSLFPNNTYQALNYWVDVVFSTQCFEAP